MRTEPSIEAALPFADRSEAGKALARRLAHLVGRDDVLVLALPRGGVPVAVEVARALRAPLDVFVVRKLGVPGHEEFAMGAIASNDTQYIDADTIEALQIPAWAVSEVAEREKRELERRERLYRGAREPLDLSGRILVLVDDGLATGATMLAAIAAARKGMPARIVVAVPVAARSSCDALKAHADEVVCAATPEPFRAVGLWYRDFAQTSDDDVRFLLARAAEARPSP